MKRLEKMLLNGEVEVRVRTATGRLQTVKRATRNEELASEIKREGFRNMATGCWQTLEIVEYKVDGEWTQVKEEKAVKRERMSYEEAVEIIKEAVEATVEKVKNRKFENSPRYFITYSNGNIQYLATGFEVVAKAKRIKEIREVMGA